MTLVDNELAGNSPDLTFPPVSAGNYLCDVIKKNLDEFGDSMWMTDVSTGKSVNYSELLTKLENVTSALLKRGFRPEDRVLYMAANHIEFPIVFFAVWKIGGSNACLTLNLTPIDIKARIIETGAKFIVTDEERAPRILEAMDDLETIREVFVIGQHLNCTPIDHLLQDDSCVHVFNDGDIERFDTEALAWLLYSSGTTGTPKAITHPHRTASKLITYYRNRLCPRRKFLLANNMVNASGYFFSIGASVSHTQMYIMSDFTDEAFLSSISQVKPYQISCYPMQLAWMCRHPQLDTYDLSSVVVMAICGSCPFPHHERQIFDKIPNLLALVTVYGLSEVFGVSTNAPTNEELNSMNKAQAVARHIIGSQGKLYPFNKLKVIDPNTGEKVGPNQVGEICVKTIFMTSGYLNRPEETANAIREGWFHTGDQGYFDSEENIYVTGRFKELIKYREFHVMPSKIEKHLLMHPAVEDAAVVGLPHEVDREWPMAFVVLKSGQTATAEELIHFIDDKVTDEQRLRGGVRFIDQIPRNDMKKIVRHRLKNLQ